MTVTDMASQMFRGVGIDRYPGYAIVVHSKEYGSGVYSWHISKEEALHNSRIIKGIVVPVRYKADGELITPPLATAYMLKRIGGTSFIP